MAALLAVGDGAVAGGPTALVLWRVRERRQGEPIYITVDRKVRRPRGVEIRRANGPPEWSRRNGIRVLMPAPALLECASILGERDLRRTVNQALVVARANDAAKQGRLEAQGYQVLRVRWSDLANARLRRALQTAAGSKP